MKVSLLPELLKEKVAELLKDVNGICCQSELPIGEYNGKVITITVYSQDEAIAQEFELESENTCIEVTE